MASSFFQIEAIILNMDTFTIMLIAGEILIIALLIAILLKRKGNNDESSYYRMQQELQDRLSSSFDSFRLSMETRIQGIEKQMTGSLRPGKAGSLFHLVVGNCVGRTDVGQIPAVGPQPRVSAAGPVGSRGERQVFERVFLCYGSEVLRVVNDMYGRAVAADERIAVVGVEEYGSAGCKQRSLARGRVDFEKACPRGIYVGAEGAHFLVIPRSCGGPVRRVEQVVVGVAHKHSLCCGGVYFAACKGACVYRRFELVCVAELSAFDVHYRHSCVCGQVCV